MSNSFIIAATFLFLSDFSFFGLFDTDPDGREALLRETARVRPDPADAENARLVHDHRQKPPLRGGNFPVDHQTLERPPPAGQAKMESTALITAMSTSLLFMPSRM